MAWWSDSLALLSDAARMLADASALGLTTAATSLARRPPSLLHSYRLAWAELLAAQPLRRDGWPPRADGSQA